MSKHSAVIAAAFAACAIGGPSASAATIRTVSAVYGNLEAQRTCDATSAVANLCDGRAECVVDIGNNKLCGDPDFLVVKKIRIQYRCGRRPARSLIVDEYKAANIACP